MISAGIRNVKNNLSRLLAQVKSGGEEILITDRGMPIAGIIKENQGDKSIRAALAPLVQEGLITLPSRRIPKNRISAIKIPGKPISQMAIEDRR